LPVYIFSKGSVDYSTGSFFLKKLLEFYLKQ
jgi:hypothetical protein